MYHYYYLFLPTAVVVMHGWSEMLMCRGGQCYESLSHTGLSTHIQETSKKQLGAVCVDNAKCPWWLCIIHEPTNFNFTEYLLAVTHNIIKTQGYLGLPGALVS